MKKEKICSQQINDPKNKLVSSCCVPGTPCKRDSRGDYPMAPIDKIETLWFQVAGTICNLRCAHCLVSASPESRAHSMMTLNDIRPYLKEAKAMDIRDFYFTGGEPFMNREIIPILKETLILGAVTVLTNGTLITPALAGELRALKEFSSFPLEIRLSLDGTLEASNDAIRGQGSFRNILRGIRFLAQVNINPVITVTGAASETHVDGRWEEQFEALIRAVGIKQPRLKFLSLFHVGEEESRTIGYGADENLKGLHLTPEELSKLQCTNSRIITSKGVYVCPVLVNNSAGFVGKNLKESIKPFKLSFGACFTCLKEGVTCRTN